jgi:hypothetical protein
MTGLFFAAGISSTFAAARGKIPEIKAQKG